MRRNDNRTSGVAKATFWGGGGGGGEAKTKSMAHVLGMFSRKKFEIWVPEMQFQAVWGDILENFNDHKVHQRHDFL